MRGRNSALDHAPETGRAAVTCGAAGVTEQAVDSGNFRASAVQTAA
jgi:hypothetical protein